MAHVQPKPGPTVPAHLEYPKASACTCCGGGIWLHWPWSKPGVCDDCKRRGCPDCKGDPKMRGGRDSCGHWHSTPRAAE